MKFLPVFSEDLATLVFFIVFAYLLGSIPFGIIWAKVFKLGSLKDIGSCDGGKGFVTVLLAKLLTEEFTVQAVCLFVFIGHCFPIWLKFKGGKGVATYIGIVISINFIFGLVTCLIWLLSAAVLRISSFSALISTISGPFIVFFLLDSSFLGISAMLSCLIFWTHRANIRRILNGTESNINVN